MVRQKLVIGVHDEDSTTSMSDLTSSQPKGTPSTHDNSDGEWRWQDDDATIDGFLQTLQSAHTLDHSPVARMNTKADDGYAAH